jgi:cation transport regulator ChaC
MGLVFQYGSNATSARLNSPSRLDGVVRDLGRAQTIDEFDIRFDVYSQTNGCAASDLVRTPGRRAWGVLYEIPDEFMRGTRTDGRRTLARIEGSRYEEIQIRVRDAQGRERDAVTFVVKQAERREGLATSAAYVSWIVYGLRDHGVPEDYLAHVIEVALAANERAAQDAAEQTRLIRTL